MALQNVGLKQDLVVVVRGSEMIFAIDSISGYG